jgi:hypothetical protein
LRWLHWLTLSRLPEVISTNADSSALGCLTKIKPGEPSLLWLLPCGEHALLVPALPGLRQLIEGTRDSDWHSHLVCLLGYCHRTTKVTGSSRLPILLIEQGLVPEGRFSRLPHCWCF